MRLLLCFHKLRYESTLQYTDEEGHGQPPGCLKHELGLKGIDPFKKKDNMIIYVNLLKPCWKTSMKEETKMGVVIDFSIKTTRSKLEVPRQHTPSYSFFSNNNMPWVYIFNSLESTWWDFGFPYTWIESRPNEDREHWADKLNVGTGHLF
jgi:hypothetical protein